MDPQSVQPHFPLRRAIFKDLDLFPAQGAAHWGPGVDRNDFRGGFPYRQIISGIAGVVEGVLTEAGDQRVALTRSVAPGIKPFILK